MLTIFARHKDACVDAYKKAHDGALPGRDFRKCKCPLHTEGTLGGKMLRRALGTSSWTVAQARVRQAEADGAWEVATTPAAPQYTIKEQAVLFIASTHSRGSTLRRIQATLLGCDAEYMRKCKAKNEGWIHNVGLAEMCASKGYTTLAQVTLPDLTELTTSWTLKPEQMNKRIGTVRRFYRYALAAKWVPDLAPAMGLNCDRSGKNALPQIPFDGAHLPQDGPELSAVWAYTAALPKLDALVKLMRYAGLRISDAATFSTARIMPDGSIFLFAAKTGEPVTIPMHPAITAALALLTPNAAGYYFCSGSAKLSTATDNWRVRIDKMFESAGVASGHAHRFRHTFAVDLLLRGVDITHVQAAMAHTSIKTTQRYLAFVAARRRQIADALKSAWAVTATLPPAPQPTPAVAPAPGLSLVPRNTEVAA